MIGRQLLVLVAMVTAGCGGGGTGSDDAAPMPDAAVYPDGALPPPPPEVCAAPVDPVDTTTPDHVVGDGTPASCTEAALRAAVSAGGVITFACGAAPATIVVTSALTPTADTVLDGGQVVTISGGDTTRIVDMNTGNFEATGPSLTVQRITLRNGHAAGAVLDGGGGAIYYVGGSVTAIDAVFLDNVAADTGPDVAGGAIFGIGVGATTVVGSRFAGNRASNGGAIGALGSAVTIVNSTISDNRATGFGANYVENNVQMGEGGNGGAVSMDGMGRALYVCGSTFQRNSSGAFGGAIFRTGYATESNEIHDSAFLDNEARDRTGAEADLPSGAGALYLQGVHVTMTGTTVAGNHARSSAGVWILGHGTAPAIAHMVNVTITGNSTYPRSDLTMRGVSAGLTIGDNTTGPGSAPALLNVTIAGNAAQFGSGIWNASPLLIRNSIIANDAENVYTPLNCTGTMYDHPPATGDSNVQWPTGLTPAADMDCTPGIVRLDPMMGPLGDNGGPTPTMAPGNAALPQGTQCPALDQRGNARGDPCTIGALELP